MYFLEVCVVFSRAHIAFPKDVEVKHTIYFDWPKSISPLGPSKVCSLFPSFNGGLKF